MSEQKKWRAEYSPLSEKEIDEAEENLVRCLDAYDQKGEAGLQKSLDLIYPRPLLVRKPIPGTYDCYAQWSDKSYMEARQVTPEEEAEAERMYPATLAENPERFIGLHRTMFNDKGEIVGPDYWKK